MGSVVRCFPCSSCSTFFTIHARWMGSLALHESSFANQTGPTARAPNEDAPGLSRGASRSLLHCGLPHFYFPSFRGGGAAAERRKRDLGAVRV